MNSKKWTQTFCSEVAEQKVKEAVLKATTEKGQVTFEAMTTKYRQTSPSRNGSEVTAQHIRWTPDSDVQGPAWNHVPSNLSFRNESKIKAFSEELKQPSLTGTERTHRQYTVKGRRSLRHRKE